MPHKREKTSIFLLAALLTLSACAAPSVETVPPTPSAVETPTPTPTPEETPALYGFPIDDTHDAFEVPTGGKLGTVLVTVEMVEGEYEPEIIPHAILSVWTLDDLTQPIQTVEVWGFTDQHEWLDANFDGYMDFCYTLFMGASNKNDSLWLWDEEAGQFVYGGEFLGYGLAPDQENKLVYLYQHESAASGVTGIYRWKDDELVCERLVSVHYPEYLEDGTVQQLLTVEDHINGEMVEVYSQMFGDPSESEEIYAEASLWFDLDYGQRLWGFPIDDTHDAFEVPTGGKLGTVLVTVEIENEDAEKLHLSVWSADDLEKPLQTMTAERIWSFHWYDVRDANFDGYMDFGYMYAMGNQPAYYHYWIWDEEQGLFVLEPGFDKISWPEFDEETGIISGYSRDGDAGLSGHTTFHQWIDGRLVCIRRVETWVCGREGDVPLVTLTVQDRVDGALTTVFQRDYHWENGLAEADRWCDLDYHGE